MRKLLTSSMVVILLGCASNSNAETPTQQRSSHYDEIAKWYVLSSQDNSRLNQVCQQKDTEGRYKTNLERYDECYREKAAQNVQTSGFPYMEDISKSQEEYARLMKLVDEGEITKEEAEQQFTVYAEKLSKEIHQKMKEGK